MPQHNRVTPRGELVADPGRGLVYGNRGCLHDELGRIERRFHRRRWISCRLEFRGWKRAAPFEPGRYTGLYFLDEVTALAAGHRPCALCRNADYREFVTIWHELHPDDPPGADEIDRRLHAERVDSQSRGQRVHEALLDELPDGSFVLHDGVPHLVSGGELARWTPAGYDAFVARPARMSVTVLTPASLVGVLRAEWRPDVPLVHPSATLQTH